MSSYGQSTAIRIDPTYIASQEFRNALLAELLTDERPTEAQRVQFARWIRDGHRKGVFTPARPSGDPASAGRLTTAHISVYAHARALSLPPHPP